MTEPKTPIPWWWLVMWGVDVLILAALLIYGVKPAVWLSAAFLLFFVPEFIGIHKSKDRFAPLTQVIRHHLPRWLIFPIIGGAAAWAVMAWWDRPHHILITVIIVAIAAWGIDHFDVTYDNAPE